MTVREGENSLVFSKEFVSSLTYEKETPTCSSCLDTGFVYEIHKDQRKDLVTIPTFK